MQTSALALLLCLSSTLAFSPTVSTKAAWGTTTTTNTETSLSMAEDLNFDDVNVARLLGLNRVKNIIKRNKSKTETALKASAAPDTSDAPTAASKRSGLKLIIAGAPASGKGTQCEMIKKDYGVVHLSTGDMLRAAVADGTDVGVKAKEFMDAGKLVPDEVIIGVVSTNRSSLFWFLCLCLIIFYECMCGDMGMLLLLYVGGDGRGNKNYQQCPTYIEWRCKIKIRHRWKCRAM